MKRIGFFTLWLLAACQTSPPGMTDAERAQAEAAVAEVLQVFITSGNALDATMAATMYHEQATLVDFFALYRGRAEIEEHLAGLFSQFQEWESSWDDLEVDVVGPGLAVFFGQFTATRRRTDGRLQRTDPYVWLTGWAEESEAGWGVTHAHLSGTMITVQEEGA